jgi:hypothetical protein
MIASMSLTASKFWPVRSMGVDSAASRAMSARPRLCWPRSAEGRVRKGLALEQDMSTLMFDKIVHAQPAREPQPWQMDLFLQILPFSDGNSSTSADCQTGFLQVHTYFAHMRTATRCHGNALQSTVLAHARKVPNHMSSSLRENVTGWQTHKSPRAIPKSAYPSLIVSSENNAVIEVAHEVHSCPQGPRGPAYADARRQGRVHARLVINND